MFRGVELKDKDNFRHVDEDWDDVVIGFKGSGVVFRV